MLLQEEELIPGVPSVHGHGVPSSWDNSQVMAELCKVSLEPLEWVLLPPWGNWDVCAVLSHDPSPLTKHRNKLGLAGRAAREVLATECGSLVGSWDYREEYCLSRSVSMGVHLGTVNGIFRRTQNKEEKETTTIVVQRVFVTVSEF